MSYGYKKGYNPQKYAENRKAEKERTYQMIDDTAIEVSRSPDKLKEFLAVQAKFDMYSAANTLLMMCGWCVCRVMAHPALSGWGSPALPTVILKA